MKLMLFATVVLVVLNIGCSTRPLQKFQMDRQFLPELGKQDTLPPTLKLEAHPKVGFAPLRVTVRAQLQNTSHTDPTFDCLWKSWNFGDGSVSSEKSACDQAGTFDTEYDQEHVFRKPGIYLVQFVLGDTQLLSNPVQIRVLGR